MEICDPSLSSETNGEEEEMDGWNEETKDGEMEQKTMDGIKEEEKRRKQ